MKIEFDEEELQALYLRCNGYLPDPSAALRRAVAKLYAAQHSVQADETFCSCTTGLVTTTVAVGICGACHKPFRR